MNPLLYVLHPKRLFYKNTWCNDVFVKYLRKNGVKIGDNTRFICPAECHIDPGRMDYITIGDNCCLVNVTILAHDYSWYVLAESHKSILPDPGGEVKIGNNCFIGYQTCILKGTTIGDNVIIGARSVVKGTVPSNTVWAGSPAKQICTLDEFYKKRIDCRLKDAVARREHIKKIYHRDPTILEMGMFAFLFLERTNENYNSFIKQIEFNGVKDSKLVKDLFFKTIPLFDSFDSFLNMGYK